MVLCSIMTKKVVLTEHFYSQSYKNTMSIQTNCVCWVTMKFAVIYLLVECVASTQLWGHKQEHSFFFIGLTHIFSLTAQQMLSVVCFLSSNCLQNKQRDTTGYAYTNPCQRFYFEPQQHYHYSAWLHTHSCQKYCGTSLWPHFKICS